MAGKAYKVLNQRVKALAMETDESAPAEAAAFLKAMNSYASLVDRLARSYERLDKQEQKAAASLTQDEQAQVLGAWFIGLPPSLRTKLLQDWYRLNEEEICKTESATAMTPKLT
jgi:hypothetical protein